MRETGHWTFLATGAALLLIAAAGCSTESTAVRQLPTDPQHGASSACPNGNALGTFQPAVDVTADFSNNGNVTTYGFASLRDEHSNGGVPGLIKYCVYTSPAARPTAITVAATGANGAQWTFKTDSGDFSFGRPDGNPTNIPLDGTSTLIGTATWGVVPDDQTILLHINDPGVCASLYGGAPGTCFVKPAQASACIRGIGETNVAYNAIPLGAADCARSSLGFEATATKEFGNLVQLGGAARELVSLKVLFSSWGCETGHWYGTDCSTVPGHTFTHPVTAKIYAVNDCGGTPCPGALLASVTQTLTVPYRPSADNTGHCTGSDIYTGAGAWFNAVAGLCRPQISIVLTFTFTPGTTLPDRVIWAVAYNTTHYGDAPIGEGPTCFTSSGGCPYDSFNVGAESFPNAPYVGSDLFPTGAWRNGVIELPPPPDNDWTGYRPLGEITTR